jgi:hypothetical protein
VLKVVTTPANRRDEQVVPEMLEALKRSSTRLIRSLLGDKGYGFAETIAQVEQAGIEPVLSEREEPQDAHGSGLGRIRSVVEQTLSHFGLFRRLRCCYEKRGDLFQAFHDLAAALLCYKRLNYYLCYTGRL